MLIETEAGLHCPRGGFHIDPWQPVSRAVVTHAHGDHARPGSAHYLCTPETRRLLLRRFGAEASVETISYGVTVSLGDVRLSLHSAGHVLGSAQVRIEGPEGVWVLSGDYKRVADPTCTPFEPVRCDTFITESTFGLPIYRWDRTDDIVTDLLTWRDRNTEERRTSVLFCYTIGKAQRILAELRRRTDRPAYVHGMMLAMIDAYEQSGVEMLDVRPVIERTERGRASAKPSSPIGELVLAPLSARGTPWMRRLGDISDAFASGLMRVRGVRRQRAFDRGFVLSDHADWPALLDTITETGASRVLATHGHAEALARHLGTLGLESGTLRTAWEGEAAQQDEG